MNIEETNQLLLEKEVIVEDDVRNKSEDEDEEDEEDEDDDNDNDKLGAAKTVLDPFQFCKKLDICNWLLKNPDILRLANEMNESSYVISSKNTEVSINTIWGTTGNLSQKEIKEYFDENVMQKLLNRQLAAVNILELTNNGGTDMLVEFVKEAIRVSWDGKNLSGIKELYTMTKNLIIPS
ncbi:hypothetical protein GLOIN_2v1786777 [Rhizophagus irregularis DAOM 181602=DAOM 197198]|nr:hypothetical protein GLOIN_2v1786777 [Rhizophagus irregularis DAOM 181602=DAOM 197198]